MNCPACDHVNVDGARYCAKCGALMPVAHVDGNDPMIGTVVGGRYRITGLLGEGGMGRVYTGEQQMGTAVRKVAVKTLLQEFSKDPQVVARFMRECGTVVELEHPNTIKFYDFGQTDSGDLYIAMEFVDGRPLAEVIETQGAMTFERVEKIMKQICGSLHEAHEKGVVHRDLKPENVILTTRAGETDFVKVLDFGIAKRQDAAESNKQEQKLTQAGMVLGTPPYMSPEQFTGKELDRRSDVYSLGVMSYEMLTGRLPFDANTPWEWATQHMTQQPFPFEKTGPMAAQIPPPMKSAILRALSKDRDGRQDTARQFFDELSTGAQRLSSVDTGIPTAGGMSTEAFPMTGGGAPRAGNTQIGEPFVPPVEAGVGVAPTAPGVGMHQNVPTAGGQAVPAPPPVRGRDGGGGKGLYIAAAGLLAALLVVGIVVAFGGGGGGDDGETDGPLLPPPTTVEPAGNGDDGNTADDGNATDDGNDGDDGTSTEASSPSPEPPSPTPKTQPSTQPSTQPTTQPPQPPQPPQPASGDAACSQAIAAAQAKNCAAARAALANCSGARQHIAAANVNSNCQRRRFLGR